MSGASLPGSGTGSFTEKLIVLTFKLGTGSFGGSGYDTMTVSGLRVLLHVENVIGNTFSAAASMTTVRIYGLTLSQMNQLTKAGLMWNNRNNLIGVQAGDVNGMTTIFVGHILEAYPDFSEMPESAFVVSAYPGGDIALKPAPPISYPGPAAAGAVMGSIAGNAGLSYEGNGVNTQLVSPYFAGTAMEQIVGCAEAANVFAYIDPATQTLAVWPKNGSRAGNPIQISAATGMIGYPEFQTVLIRVRAIYSPAVKVGGQIQVQSQLAAASGGANPANGIWTVIRVDYDLSSLMPDGPWEMTITGFSPNLPG